SSDPQRAPHYTPTPKPALRCPAPIIPSPVPVYLDNHPDKIPPAGIPAPCIFPASPSVNPYCHQYRCYLLCASPVSALCTAPHCAPFVSSAALPFMKTSVPACSPASLRPSSPYPPSPVEYRYAPPMRAKPCSGSHQLPTLFLY